MALITDQSTLFNFTHSVALGQFAGSGGELIYDNLLSVVHSVKWLGQNAGSAAMSTIDSAISTNFSTVGAGAINSTYKINTLFNTYFKMQGFNTATQQYENWHSMGTALMNPPSGNALTNVSVIATWQDR